MPTYTHSETKQLKLGFPTIQRFRRCVRQLLFILVTIQCNVLVDKMYAHTEGFTNKKNKCRLEILKLLSQCQELPTTLTLMSL